MLSGKQRESAMSNWKWLTPVFGGPTKVLVNMDRVNSVRSVNLIWTKGTLLGGVGKYGAEVVREPIDEVTKMIGADHA